MAGAERRRFNPLRGLSLSGAKGSETDSKLTQLLAGLLLVVLFPAITTILPRLFDFKH